MRNSPPVEQGVSMAGEIAGIYFVKQPEDAFYVLSPERQARLARFLNGQRETLEPPEDSPHTITDPAGYALKDCAHEWEHGCVVYWDVNLKPKEPSLSLTHINAYRIEVLEIRTNGWRRGRSRKEIFKK
jgi:hypothetical protein